jgi:hypothetical protein
MMLKKEYCNSVLGVRNVAQVCASLTGNTVDLGMRQTPAC